MDIQIYRMQETGRHCNGKNCKRNPNYLINILGSVWYIKVDTVVAQFTIGGSSEIYCRECIGDVYLMMKTKLDSKLWAYH
jgi:hypothetical protein